MNLPPTIRGAVSVLMMFTAGANTAAAQTVAAWGSNSSGQATLPALAGRVVGVSAGSNHSLALLGDGTVAAWGSTSYGQTAVPAELNGVRAVAAGNGYSMALRDDGTVIVWGTNSLQPAASLTGVAAIAAGGYPLALRTDGTVFEWSYNGQSTGLVPAALSGVTAIAAGGSHGLALQSSGRVVAWSRYNSYGQATVPATLPPAQAIAAGSDHSLALLQNGTVVAWGRNSSSQATVPADLADVVAIAAGSDFSLAVKANGTVVGWGSTANGRLTVPAGTGHIRTLTAGGGHSLALTDSTAAEPPVILSPSAAVTNATGTVASDLSFQHRVVASGAPFRYAAAPLPPGLTLNPFTGVISGVPAQPGYFEVALSAQNSVGLGTQTLRLWVQGAPGFLGLPAVLPLSVTQVLRDYWSNLPTQWSATGLPPGLSLHPGTGAIAGSTVQPGVFNVHFTARNAWGEVEADWRVDVTRVAALGTQAKQVGGLGRVAGMSAYKSYQAFLKEDGTVTSNSGFFNNRQPLDLNDVRSLAAGTDFMLAVKSDGAVAGWPDQTQSPWGARLPAGLNGVVATATGDWQQYGFGLALRKDGTVHVFGGYYRPYEVEVAFQGLSGVVAISAYESTVHAVKNDGMVFSLEGNISPFEWVPRPASLTDIVAISTNLHTLALRRNGTVMAWGRNGAGQCNVPAALVDVVAVAAGSGFSLALKRDGTVVSWGFSGYGGTALLPGLRGVVAVAAGDYGLALCGLTTGEVPVIISPAAAITQSDGPTGLGVPFHYRIVATGTPVQFTASGLPPGLTLNGTTGLISGVARQAGEYDVALGARNATGTGTRTVRFHVNDVAFYSGMPGMVNAASASIQLSAPNGPHTWSTTPLPAGLSLNPGTGVISGTPLTPGTYSVTITATNAYGSAQHTLTVEVPTVLALGSKNVELPRGLSRILAIAPAPEYPLVLEESGRVSQFTSSYPIPAGLADVVAIAASRSGTYMALQSNGEVVSWYSSSAQRAPTVVTDAAAIAAGDGHLLALRRNGTIAAWGANSWGQCDVPAGLSDVVAIAAGYGHSVALRSNGTVVAWGLNDQGHQTEVPANLAGVRAIAAGGNHSYAIGSGGLTGWGAWPYNYPPPSLGSVSAVACGSAHTAGLMSGSRSVAEWTAAPSGTSVVLPASGLTGVAAIAAGGDRTIAFHGRPFNVRPVILSPRRALTAAAGVSAANLAFQYQIVATGQPTSYGATGLPAGLTVNAGTGRVDGFPSEAGAYDITLRATNSTGSGTAVLRLHVLGVPELLEPEISLNAATPVQRQIGVSAAPTAWNATGLPPGLTLDPATGVLTGTVAAPGTHLVALNFSNPRYAGSGNLRLLILPPRDTALAAYAAWRDFHWKPTAYDRYPAQDADGDGRINLLEFALGTDPRVAEQGDFLQFSYNSEGRLELQVSVTSAAVAALLIRAQFSAGPDFGVERAETLAAEPPVAEEQGRLRLRFTAPGGSARQFGRLVFTLPE